MAAAVFAALLLSTAGVFDTEAVRFGPRLLYWLAIAAVSTLSFQLFQVMLRAFFSGIDEVWLRLAGWVVLTLPLNTVAVLGCKILFGGVPSLNGFLLLLPGMASILAALQMTLIGFEARRSQAEVRPVPELPAESLPATGLHHLLPLPLQRSRVHAVKAEDHYVRVYTENGQALIRMRMSDAVALLPNRDGLRPHRSWWVAKDAIASMERAGGRTILKLRDGTTIPVSRSAKPQLGPRFAASGPPGR